jgi:hypothetical protein
MKSKIQTLALGLTALLLTMAPFSSVAAPQKSGIEGQALVYQPGFMVEISPGNWIGDGGFYYPTATSFSVWLPHSRHPVGNFSTAADGSFQVSLPPGIYIVIPDALFALTPTPTSTEITVTPQHYTEVFIYYEPIIVQATTVSP